MHASAAQQEANSDADRTIRSHSEALTACKLRIQARNRLGLLVCRAANHEQYHVLSSSVKVDLLTFQKRVTRFLQPSSHQILNRFVQVWLVLCVYVLDTLSSRGISFASPMGRSVPDLQASER